MSTTDDEMKNEIDAIAALIGASVDDGTAETLDYTIRRSFGPVQYRAVATPSSGGSDRLSPDQTSNNDEEA